ncbi:FUBP1 [Symbiodinium sp. CCMP2456]|nr:FUBP1 [Symbiodinium sp. CCMP2456]
MGEIDGERKRPAEDAQADADAAVETAQSKQTERPRKRRSGWDDVGDGSQALPAAPPSIPMSVPPGAAVVEFKVDQGVVGFLIGKGGETLRSMEVSSTATIKIDQTSKEMGYSMVRITGSEQAVAVAKALLDGRISEKRQNASGMHRNRTEVQQGQEGGGSGAVGWETQIEQSAVGFFIGKQGEYIKRIQAQTGATVVIDQETKDYGYSMIRIMDGPGLREASEMVKYRLDQVKEAAVQRAPAGEYEELSVPQGQVGAIIGRGGDTLRQIKAESGAIIVLSQETKGQGFSTVRFAGSQDAVLKAKDLVQQRLAEREWAAQGAWSGGGGGGNWSGSWQYGKGDFGGGINPPPPPHGKGKDWGGGGLGLSDDWGGSSGFGDGLGLGNDLGQGQGCQGLDAGAPIGGPIGGPPPPLGAPGPGLSLGQPMQPIGLGGPGPLPPPGPPGPGLQSSPCMGAPLGALNAPPLGQPLQSLQPLQQSMPLAAQPLQSLHYPLQSLQPPPPPPMQPLPIQQQLVLQPLPLQTQPQLQLGAYQMPGFA